MLLLTLSLQLLPFSGLANQSSLVGVEHIVTGEPMWEYRHRLHGENTEMYLMLMKPMTDDRVPAGLSEALSYFPLVARFNKQCRTS